MKSLLPPLLAVVLSVAGTAYGCHVSGMPARDVALATTLAAGAALLAVGSAVILARSRRRAPRTAARIS